MNRWGRMLNMQKEIEMAPFYYQICNACNKRFDFDNSKTNCPICNDDLTVGVGLCPKNPDDRKLFEELLQKRKDFKATCIKCAHIFVCETDSTKCPKCGGNVNLISNVADFNVRQAVKIVAKEQLPAKNKWKHELRTKNLRQTVQPHCIEEPLIKRMIISKK